jgi:hypothetical protein
MAESEAGHASTIRRRRTAVTPILLRAIRFERSTAPGTPWIGRRCGESEIKYDQWETTNKNNNLRLRLDHGCVLFAKNAPQQPHLRGSFIAGVRDLP